MQHRRIPFHCMLNVHNALYNTMKEGFWSTHDRFVWGEKYLFCVSLQIKVIKGWVNHDITFILAALLLLMIRIPILQYSQMLSGCIFYVLCVTVSPGTNRKSDCSIWVVNDFLKLHEHHAIPLFSSHQHFPLFLSPHVMQSSSWLTGLYNCKPKEVKLAINVYENSVWGDSLMSLS